MPTTKTKPAPLTADEKAARLQEAQDTMAREVAKLRTSDDWLRWLKTARRFHNYSWSNVLLAMAQGIERDMKPLTRMAGFHAWLDLGRSVNKGEKGLKIFAPVLVKIKPGEKGYNPATPDRKKVVGFRLTSTFDVQQTSGDPLPEPPTFTYPKGEVPFGLRTALLDYAASIGFPASFAPIPGSQAEGYTDPVKRVIVISSEHEDDDARACMILIHEIAHASLHTEPGYDYTGHRGVAETEAESVAFVVGDFFGIDMGDQSFHYVAGWAPDLETVVKVGDRILKTAKAIIAGVEKDVQQVKVEADPAVSEPVATEPEPEPEPIAEPVKAQILGVADKVTMPQARKAFRAGKGVLVTETPRGETVDVFTSTTVNRQSETYTWEALHTNVKEWRGRHPRQTFYVVREAEPAEPVKAAPVTAAATVATPGVAAVIEANLKAQREGKAEPVAVAGPPVVAGEWALFA